jgi:hypothetical protein
MNSVIQFPSAVAPSMTDPPANYRTGIIELEHEVSDLQVVVAEQAVRLSKRQDDHPLWSRRLRVNAAILMAFSTGCLLDFPVVPAFAKVNVAIPLPAVRAPAFWI